MCPADLSTGKIPHGHTTPLDGMNTYILTGRWAKQAPQDILRPLRLTKTTDSAPKKGGPESEGVPQRPLPMRLLMQPTAVFGETIWAAAENLTCSGSKNHARITGKQYFIEKQHGRMNLLQPIISIVRHKKSSVKGTTGCFSSNNRSFFGEFRPPGGGVRRSGRGIRNWWAGRRRRKPAVPVRRGRRCCRPGRRSGRWRGGWPAPRCGRRCGVP